MGKTYKEQCPCRRHPGAGPVHPPKVSFVLWADVAAALRHPWVRDGLGSHLTELIWKNLLDWKIFQLGLDQREKTRSLV